MGGEVSAGAGLAGAMIGAWVGMLAWAAAGACTAAVLLTAGLTAARWALRHRQPRPRTCPWCGTHECLDKTRCNCETPCGSWLCTAREATRG